MESHKRRALLNRGPSTILKRVYNLKMSLYIYIYSIENFFSYLTWDITITICRHNILVVSHIILRPNKQTTFVGQTNTHIGMWVRF